MGDTIQSWTLQKQHIHDFPAFDEWAKTGTLFKVGKETVGIFPLCPFTLTDKHPFLIQRFCNNIQLHTFVP